MLLKVTGSPKVMHRSIPQEKGSGEGAETPAPKPKRSVHFFSFSDPQPKSCGCRALFNGCVGSKVAGSVTLRNLGTTAMFFDWEVWLQSHAFNGVHNIRSLIDACREFQMPTQTRP